jgi:hypothetical protein
MDPQKEKKKNNKAIKLKVYYNTYHTQGDSLLAFIAM